MQATSPTDKVLNPTVVKLGLISLFADISSEMLYPVTPIFLTMVLGASMSSLGLIEGFAEAVASLLKTYSGAWSDRLNRRKPFIVVSYFLAAIAKPLVGMSSNWTEVFAARALDRTGKGLRGGPRDAMIAEAVAPNLRGAAFGWHRGMDTLGAAIGPLLAILYLSAFPRNLRGIYFWSVIPGLLAAAIALTLREKRSPSISVSALQLSWNWSDFPVSFRRYLFTWTIFSLANSSDVFLLVKAKQSGLSLNATILIYCFYNLVFAFMSPALGGLSDKFGRKPLLGAGLAVFALVYAGFTVAHHAWQFWLLFGIYGLYMAATDGVGKAFAIDLIEPTKKATAIGMLGTVTGISTLFASSIAGLLWDYFGANYTFLFGAGGAVLAVLSLSRIRS